MIDTLLYYFILIIIIKHFAVFSFIILSNIFTMDAKYKETPSANSIKN